jgi:hypothetical protein
MKRLLIVPIVIGAMLFALPALAKKPDNPGKPGPGPTNPPACTIAEDDESHLETVTAYGARQYSVFWIPVTLEDLDKPVGQDLQDLCVEVTLLPDDAHTDSLSDMNVALVDYPDPAARRCGFYWPGGKINEGDVFNVRFSLEGYDGEEGFCGSLDEPDEPENEGLFVLVMPKLHAKTDEATLNVRIGFADDAP